jgi:D-3-phosphoglycerate dehydrogenase
VADLQFRGAVVEKDTRLICSAFAAGLLEQALEEHPNIVNALMLLQERGIKLQESKSSECSAFQSVLQAELQCGSQRVAAAATIFGNNMPRLVQIGGHRLEAYLDGIMMVFTHDDVPGIIGKVGTIFGSHRVNIAQMSVGRDAISKSKGAVGALNLDNEPPPAAIQEVLAQEGIHSAHVVKLPPSGQLPDWLS